MKYFTIKELCKSATASKKGIKNEPGKEERDNLIALIENVLDPLREAMGEPILVNSGYRCPKVNQLCGGAKNSQHMTGQAADIQTVADRHNRELFERARKMDYDQLIYEFGSDENPDWVHVSYRSPEENRHQVLRAVKSGGRTVYIKLN